MRHGSGLDEGRMGEKWTSRREILKVRMIGFVDRFVET